MKKLTMVVLCVLLSVFMVTACAAEPAETTVPEESAVTDQADASVSAESPEETGAGSQGIPEDWVEIEPLSEKYPGPEVSLADWLEGHEGLKGNENYRIAMIQYSMQNEFPVLMAEAAEKRAGQLGITVEFFDAEGDVNKELEICENAIADGYDAIILNPVDSSGSYSLVTKCNEANIPIVCVNALLDNLEGLAGSCSSDHIQSGELVAEYIIEECLKGEGNIVIPEGPFAQSATLDRSQGIYNIVKENPGINIVAHDTANWSRSEALDLMENWLNAYPETIDAIVGENDEMALGALQAVKTSSESERTIYAGGIDCIADALTAIENGEMACTVLQDAIAQSAIGLDIAVLALNGELQEGEGNVWVPYELVTADKVDEYRMRTDLSVLD